MIEPFVHITGVASSVVLSIATKDLSVKQPINLAYPLPSDPPTSHPLTQVLDQLPHCWLFLWMTLLPLLLTYIPIPSKESVFYYMTTLKKKDICDEISF